MDFRAFWVACLLLTWSASASEGALLAPDSSGQNRKAEDPIAAAKGNSLYGKGRATALTGLALLPVSALALIPVLDEGAFGITAADPGFSVFFALTGLALIHVGIPI